FGKAACQRPRVKGRDSLLSRGKFCGILGVANGSTANRAVCAAAGLDAEALDFLVEGRKRNLKTLGSFRLVPIRALEHVDDDAAFDFFQNFEERGRGSGRARTNFARKRRQEFGELQTDTLDDFARANTFGKQIHVHRLLGRKHNGALDNVLELTHIAGPIVVHQELHRGVRKASRRLVVLAAELVEKTLDELGDIFLPLAERRQLQRNDVEAVIQVLAETAFANQLHQIFVGGRENANVDLDCIGAAETHELALLNDAEQLGLRFRANRGDFVEENRPLVSYFEKAFLRRDRAGEGAFHMAEQLRFEQIDGDGTR